MSTFIYTDHDVEYNAHTPDVSPLGDIGGASENLGRGVGVAATESPAVRVFPLIIRLHAVPRETKVGNLNVVGAV